MMSEQRPTETMNIHLLTRSLNPSPLPPTHRLRTARERADSMLKYHTASFRPALQVKWFCRL